MSGSANKLNRDTVAENETIFDFLKRKKQFSLQNTINKTLHNQSQTKRKMDIDLQHDFPQARDLTKYNTHDSHRYARTARHNITPKKIQFQEPMSFHKSPPKQSIPSSYHQPDQGRTFFSMISHVKNRSSSALQEKDKQNRSESKSSTKQGKGDSINRKNLTKAVNSIKETISSLNQRMKLVKEKSHGLSVLFNPILNSISDSNHPLSRQVGQLRNKLRSFSGIVESMGTEGCEQNVEALHRNLEEYLQMELGSVKRETDRWKDNEISNIKKDKQVQIDQLHQEIKKMERENSTLIRRLDKLENNKDKFEEATTERQINYVQQLDRLKTNYEATIQQLKTKNASLENKLIFIQEQGMEAEKNYRNQKYLRENLENKYSNEIRQIVEAKDAYLLNQIMVLKTEFSVDIQRINEFHKMKQSQLLQRIAKKDEQMNRQIFDKGCDKQIESKILEEANKIKQENAHLKTKAECIVSDMYRMNEELYQHWMALKDVKLLLTRLGSFPQFRKIYDDLAFNEHLFH